MVITREDRSECFIFMSGKFCVLYTYPSQRNNQWKDIWLHPGIMLQDKTVEQGLFGCYALAQTLGNPIWYFMTTLLIILEIHGKYTGNKK